MWAGPRADTVRLVAVQRQTVVATLGVRFAELKPGRTRVALIGAVATREDARGQGLATALLEDATGLIERSGVSTTLLWGEPIDLYRRQGFEPQGEQKIITLSGLLEGSVPRHGAIHAGFSPLLLPLMQARKTGLVRTFGDAELLAQHRNTKWSALGEGRPSAFIAFGRGVDLPGIVHEWGGDPDGVRTLLHAALGEQPALMLMGRDVDLRELGLFEATPIHSMPIALVKGPVPKDLWIWGLDGV